MNSHETIKRLLKKIAKLEFINDQLLTEISEADSLLKEVGFLDGLNTAKHAARELLKGKDQLPEEA